MDDRDYYRMRADAERNAAYAARDATACRIHMELAREYGFRAAMEPREALRERSVQMPAPPREA
ncbi:hypothetical protein DMC47_04940 [Nostoc sp. 3335mG]|nr:hypothetical protein DMC47_04940 [Nostoc sp. 3335mG]